MRELFRVGRKTTCIYNQSITEIKMDRFTIKNLVCEEEPLSIFVGITKKQEAH